MVVRDGLSLLRWEGTESGPQVAVEWFPATDCGLGLGGHGNRRRAAAFRTARVNHLAVSNSDQPSLDIGVVGEVWIGA